MNVYLVIGSFLLMFAAFCCTAPSERRGLWPILVILGFAMIGVVFCFKLILNTVFGM